jgi:phosphoserine phosphatase
VVLGGREMRTAYCFDLDGTLTTTELLPSIAAEVGIAEEMDTLTRITMDGLIPFTQSLQLRAMLLSTVPLETVSDIVSSVPLDTVIMTFIESRPDACFVVTGNLDIWLEPVFASLPCRTFSSAATLQNGSLRVEHVLDKRDPVRQLRTEGFDRVVAVGDGANDVSMFGESDLAVAFAGVHQPARAASEAADYVVFEGRQLCQLLEGL